jgi:hypothetical protein
MDACHDCGGDTRDEYYMVTDEVWHQGDWRLTEGFARRLAHRTGTGIKRPQPALRGGG